MELCPYLNFNGQCKAAFTFYADVLGGKIVGLMTHGDSPMKDQVPPEWRDTVMNARLVFGNQVLMGSDAPPQHYAAPQGISVAIGVPTLSEADRIFTALSENGTTTMPFQATFWSAGFGMLVDRFGIPWLVNCEQAPQPA